MLRPLQSRGYPVQVFDNIEGTIMTTKTQPATRNGSVRKRGDTWEARWYDPNGARRSSRRWLDAEGKPGAMFRTKAEAQRFATEKMTEARRARDGRGTYADRAPRVPTFGEIARVWIETSPGNTPKTRINYLSILDNHLLPEFEKTAINEIGPTSLKRFKAKLERAGKAAGTIKNIFRVLSPIFEMAIDDEYIIRNPVRRVEIKKDGECRASIITPAQVELLADSADEHYRTLILFAAYSGARWGEIAALRWKNVKVTNRPATEARPEAAIVNVTIEASVAEICMGAEKRARWDFDDVGLIYGKTKNRRSRDVRLPRRFLDLLGPAKGADDLVFTTPNGMPMRPDNMRRRVFAPAILEARKHDPTIPANFRFHDLRHTCASLLISKGFNPKAIMTHMGHSQISVTFDTYGHLFTDAFDELPDVLDDVMSEAHASLARSKMRAAS